MKYLLDTSTCVNLLHGCKDVMAHILVSGVKECAISEITKIELLYGAMCSDRKEENRALALQLCHLFEVIPIAECMDTFVNEKIRLRKMGMMIEDFDLLIAATAVSHQMTLVTGNAKHQGRLENIVHENWIS